MYLSSGNLFFICKKNYRKIEGAFTFFIAPGPDTSAYGPDYV